MKVSSHEQHVESGEISCPECMDRMAANGELRGEITELRHALEKAEVQQAGDAHTIASLSYKLEELKRDKDAEAREHDLWDRAMDLFNLWRTLAGKAAGRGPSKAKMNGERFWLVLPFLVKDGLALCQRAVVGRTYHHFTARRPNGSTIRYLEWERIFGRLGQGTARQNFEESANRAPKDWKERIEQAGFEVAA